MKGSDPNVIASCGLEIALLWRRYVKCIANPNALGAEGDRQTAYCRIEVLVQEIERELAKDGLPGYPPAGLFRAPKRRGPARPLHRQALGVAVAAMRKQKDRPQ